jgi:ABC-type multidrug transport system fused ATPase/permease subunit
MNHIKEHFKMPIYYNKDKMNLKSNIINDLELTTTIDSSNNSMYKYYFNIKDDSENELVKSTIEQTAEYYTTDVSFLKENQKLLKEYKPLTTKYTDYSKNYEKVLELWKEIKTDTGFKEKYYYIDWDKLEFLNRSELFLQFMSIYNLSSPIISLFVPIIILIIPFFIIKLKGVNITLSEYIEVLKFIVQTNAIGKLFTTFNAVSINEKIYLLLSAAFYVFSIYQNIMICIRFNNNMKTIHTYFNELKCYLTHTIENMENYLCYATNMTTQSEFIKVLKEKIHMLTYFRDKIQNISEYKLTNYKKYAEIGSVMKYFYELYSDPIIHDAIMYSFGFNGYIDCLEGLQKNIEERNIQCSEFITSNKKITIKNNYYACLKDMKPVKNNIKLNKNLIITGPNASGKTTILKSTLINLLFTQQFGCGFYDSAEICPFKYFHCYLNIPDTSGRDSLFQAEARRCKEILDIIEENKKELHFCVFDELYSGTNPDEAVTSAKAFMEYIVKNKKMSCLLTTHFVKVCKKLKKNVNIMNYHMETEKINDKLHYKYKLKSGISELKGGINVLADMNYPSEIIENTK